MTSSLAPLDDFALGHPVLTWIYDNFEPGARILELGGGAGTDHLGAHGYQVVSVEHDPSYLEFGARWPNVRKLHAPLVNGWYDRHVLSQIETRFDLVIIDGPPGSAARRRMLDHLDVAELFEGATVVVDDVHRGPEMYVGLTLASRFAAKGTLLPSDRGRSFFVISPPEAGYDQDRDGS